VLGEQRSWMPWVLMVSAVLCIVSFVILTLLVPDKDSYSTKGGFIPVAVR